MICHICGAEMRNRISSYTFFCELCNHWQSSLEPEIEHGKVPFYDEVASESDDCQFLKPVREKNYEKILNTLQKTGSTSKILDVGCATGQFLEFCTRRSLSAFGVEPNARLAEQAQKKGLPIYKGYFPNALPENEKFEVITYNDVLEHIPDARSVLRDSLRALSPGGQLVINGPFSEGIFFQLGKLSARTGKLALWDRLWQKGFFTPHVHYFSARSMKRLIESVGAEAEAPISLTSIALKGTWDRIRYDPNLSRTQAAAIFGGVVVGYPIVSSLPSDARFVIVRNSGNGHP